MLNPQQVTVESRLIHETPLHIYKLLITAEGFFTAVGGPDWEDGLGCGTCAQLEYQGNTVTVNVVDR